MYRIVLKRVKQMYIPSRLQLYKMGHFINNKIT